MRMPTREGFPIPIDELDLPVSEEFREVNNHHMLYYRRVFGQFALSQLVRDLDAYQRVMFVDQHQALHRKYDESLYLPTPFQMMDRVDRAYQENELLRFGPALRPVYSGITEDEYEKAKRDFEEMIR